jgi:phosphatidylserine/phosphatidylglycerophosphate/cardiolipin synthase-like enzyme
MFTSPLASVSGWNWAVGFATDLPPPLRQVFPPSGAASPAPEAVHWAVTGIGPDTGLRYPATGRWQHHQEASSTVHWIWGRAADIGLFEPLRTRLPFGNPLVAIRFDHPAPAKDEKGEPRGVTRGGVVELAGSPITTTAITIVAFAPGAPGLDSIGVLRALRDALVDASVTSGTPSWQEFVGAFDALEQPLRLLEPGGSPAVGVTVSVGAGAPVTLTPAHRGNVLTAAGIGRAAIGGRTLDITDAGEAAVAVSETADPAAVVAAPGGLVALTSTTSHVTIAPLAAWFAAQGSTALERYTRGNRVVAFADGIATYADLFGELDAAITAGGDGAFYVTGYSLQQQPMLGPSTLAHRSVADVAAAMVAAGGQPRFLALQMLQLDPTWVRDVQTAATLTSMLLMVAGAGATFFQDSSTLDQPNFFLHSQALAGLLFVGAANLDRIIEGRELNRADIEALAAIPGVEAHLDPVDADVDDNPHADTSSEIISLALEAQRRFNVFHQKIQIVRNATGIHAYCGGIDLNAGRVQDRHHASRTSPFHDVHARVNGRAAGELTLTFVERWRRASGTDLALDPDPAVNDPSPLAGLPTGGPDIVQVGRTYYGPLPGSGRGFDFAPSGERTILDTLLQAIGQARRYIYIEDQYLTPPDEMTAALEAAAGRVSGPLIVIVPSTPDQPFGLMRRLAFNAQMRTAWGDRFKVGLLRKRYSRAATSVTSASGRLWLMADIGESTADTVLEVGPPSRVPDLPFWLTVDGEVMRAYHRTTGFSSPTSVRLDVERENDTNLFTAGSGTKRSSHKTGAAVSAGSFPDIYVHSKIMLVDDAFASIGSANANRRGYYSDGECNLFALRETVADGPDNWIRALRVALWSEHLGVTEDYGRAALADPVLCLPLFSRKFTTGSRFTPFDAQPYSTEFELHTEFVDTTSRFGGLAMIRTLTAATAAAIVGTQADAIFDTIVDPGSQVE